MFVIVAMSLLGLHGSDCLGSKLERAQMLLAEGRDRDAANAAIVVTKDAQACPAEKLLARALIVRATLGFAESRQIAAQAKLFFSEAASVSRNPLVDEADATMAATIASLLRGWAAEGQGCIAFSDPNRHVEEIAPLYLKRYREHEGANVVAFALASALTRHGDLPAAREAFRRIVPERLRAEDRDQYTWLQQRLRSTRSHSFTP